jgi:two-component system, response regulator PdtaR
MTDTALIVEDEIFVALDIERILTEAGFRVAGIAADTPTALAAAPGCTFAFVDINLRDGATGSDIAQKLTASGIRVVYVTANPAQITYPDAIGYVRKPFGETAILAAADLATGRIPHDAANDDVIRLSSQARG